MTRSTGKWILALLAVTGSFFFGLRGAVLPRADLVIANGPDPRSLDPAVITALADLRILACLSEGLLDLDPQTLTPRPALARAWPDISQDRLTWTFRLREGLRWSDGAPLTASDVRWSLLRFLDPEVAARNAFVLDAVRGAAAYNRSGQGREDVGILAPDDLTLVLQLSHPKPELPAILTLPCLGPVPRHVVEREGEDWVRPEHYVCNGPFRPVLWRPRDRVRVVRNPYHRNATHVSLQTVDFLSTESANTQLNMYLSGACDVITEVPTSAVPTLITEYGAEATGEFLPSPRLGTYFYRLNVTRFPLNNRWVRQALRDAVNREAIVQDVTRAGEEPARSFVPPGTRCGTAPYAPPLIKERSDEEIRECLRRGFEELGIDPAAPPVIEILFSPDVNDQPIAEVIQSQWESLGLPVRLVNMDSGSVRDALQKLDYHVGRSSWIGDYNDPANFLEIFVTGGGGNRTGYSESAFDQLLAAAHHAPDAESRAATLVQAEARLLDDAPLITIHHYVSRSMVRPYVLGWHPNILDWHPVQFLRVGPR